MERERISITLRRQLLQKVDKIVDGMKIRNRSHAIEYLLTKALGRGISRAVILAGGPGTNMRPFTYETPKALIPVHNKALLEYTIELLKKNQIVDVIISIGHLGDKVREHFGKGDRFGINIQYVQQPKLVGTGGALAGVAGMFFDEPFILVHGDILIDIDLEDMISFHRDQAALVTMALTSAADPSHYGMVSVRRNEVVGFSEKPDTRSYRSNLINAGLYICDPMLFDYLPPAESFSLEKDVFPQLIDENKLAAYMFDGEWFDVGTPEAYERVLQEWRV
ncbi:MAG TPA: sugar phosphate nucleotidyltransferase [bacterium]|nr:sugar phosphate nucleotidyltransferase [bacterium]